MTIQELILKHDGSRFQEELARFIVEKNLCKIVETGMGVSSIHILNALDKIVTNVDRMLISIDPSAWFEDRFAHPLHKLVEQKSIEAMLDVYYQWGPWDCFLHDGDHEILCQTYEANLAYDFLKPGGYLFFDDAGWNGHGAWDRFVQEKELSMFKLGDLYGIQKPLDKPYCPSSEAKFRHSTYLEIALARESNWLAAGGIKHPAFAND